MTVPPQGDLIGVLMGEDELGAVIRAHLLVESQLLSLFELLIRYPEHLEKLRLGYRQRVDLALSLGLKPQYGPPLRKFGQIRNDFAHKPNTTLTKKHVNELYGACHRDDRRVILTSFESTKLKIEGSTAKAFKALDPKDRFVLIVVALHSVLLAAVMELQREQDAT